MPARRRRTTTLAALAAATTAAALAIACGIDAVATKDNILPGADTGDEPVVVLPETGPVPEGGPPPDAPLDGNPETGCPAGHGPMVEVHDAGGLTFCIDSTEVTNDAYAKFVAATDGGDVESGVFDAGAPPACSSNTSYASTGPMVGADFPIVNVDWCDANAYCHWAGKRLCGKLTGADASTGEWFEACSNGGTQMFPYAGPYVGGVCNDLNVGVTSVGKFPGCSGGVDGGLLDMNGNVAELVDFCSPTGCPVMGGNYSKAGACALAEDFPSSKTSGAFYVGFRCCSDL